MTVPAAPDAAAPSPTDPPPDIPTPSLSTTATRAGDTVRTARRVWQWAARFIALLAVGVTIMVIALSIGMRANDNEITDHLGTATATVLSLSPLRTGIEFVDATGTTIRPEGGVLYPGLLALGQQFVVEYSTRDPQIARVAGRTAAVGTTQLALTQALTLLIAVPLVWFCLRRARLPLIGLRRGPGRTGLRPQPVAAGTDTA